MKQMALALLLACLAEGSLAAEILPASAVSTPLVPTAVVESTLNSDLVKKVLEEKTQKINQIEDKQREIDSEIYPAFVPPLKAEKEKLLQELNEIELRQKKIEAQNKINDTPPKASPISPSAPSR